MVPEPSSYVKYADAKRIAGRFVEAADYYNAASHGYLMQFRHLSPDDPFDDSEVYRSPKYLGSWGRHLLLAVLCYRLAGNNARAQNHCRQGILVTRDLIENERNFGGSWQSPNVGFCHELLGDFRTFGDIDGQQRAYENALDHYRDVENALGWQSEPEFEDLVLLFLNLADEVGYDIDAKNSIRYESLVKRIQLKRTHYASILETVLQQGRLDAETL